MSFNDVKVLIADEKAGDQVVSWHSKYIWDALKHKVKNDDDAVKLSKLMRKNLHSILTIFAMIDEQGFKIFLIPFLNLEYSNYDYQFPDFKPDGTFTKVIKIKKEGKNQENNKKRYVRIAFESLQSYKEKDNRRVGLWKNKTINNHLKQLFILLKKNDFSNAKTKLKEILQLVSNDLSKDWEKS